MRWVSLPLLCGADRRAGHYRLAALRHGVAAGSCHGTGVTGVIMVIGHLRAWCVISHGATFQGSQDICVAKRESTAGEKSNGITDHEAPAAGTVASLCRPGGVR